MRYGSVCSGIEGATVAWHELPGWQPAFFSEIDPFARAVLGHHYPNVPCHGDFRTIEPETYGSVDLVIGGTPCQDFSVAGLRAGLAGDRGALTIAFCDLVGRLRPRWLVWENVPGVLSADEGRAFGIFLGLLGERGHGFAYRVLDAQFFGVPQRRRRVFVVGYLGDWRPPAAVLFEREGLSWHPAPRREAWQVTPTLSESGAGVSRVKGAARSDDIEWVTASAGHHGHSSPRGDGSDNLVVAFSCKDDGQGAAIDLAPTLRSMAEVHSNQNGGGGLAVAFNLRGREEGNVPEVDPDGLASVRSASGGSSRSLIAFDLQQITHPENRANRSPCAPAFA